MNLITIPTIAAILTALFFIYTETGVFTAIAIGVLTICVLYLMGWKQRYQDDIEGYDPKTSSPQWKI